MDDPDHYYTFTIEVKDSNPLKIRDKLIDYPGKRSIFDLDKVVCEDQLKVALFRSDRAFSSNSAIAKTWGIEVIIHLFGNHQISNCLEVLGISKVTQRIGIIQDSNQIPEGAEAGIIIKPVTSELLKEYDIKGSENPCDDIISKGVEVVINHE